MLIVAAPIVNDCCRRPLHWHRSCARPGHAIAIRMSSPANIDRLFLRVLSDVDLFRHLDRRQAAALLAEATKAVFHTGEVVYYEGEQGESMYVVVQGAFEVYRVSSGDHAELAHVLPGEHFGEIALIANQPRSASVRALQPSVALRFTKSALLARPDLAAPVLKNMARMLARRLSSADDEIVLHRNRAREAEAAKEKMELEIARTRSRVRRMG